MKRICLAILLILVLLPLYSFDFFAEQASRTVSFELEPTFGLYRDKQFHQQIDLRLLAEYNEERYRGLAALTYDSAKNGLEANELSLSLFFGQHALKAGLFTHPWGSASTTHVVDVLQGRDLRRGLVDDLEKMKRPTFMTLFTSYWETSSLELLFKPGFAPSFLPTEGRYSLIPPAFATATITEMENHELSAEEIGSRYRVSLGKLDAGLLYFNGHYPDPGFSITSLAPLSIDLIYTRYQLFGLESSLLLEPFTLAFEGGFFLSEDRSGSESALFNNKLAYLAELSYTHPAYEAFVALAYQGRYVFDFSTNPSDVDFLASYDGKAYENTLIFVVEYPLIHQKLTLRGALTYQMESEGYAFLLGLSYALLDNLHVFGKATIYGALGTKSSLYKSWDDNDVVMVGLQAWF